MTKVGIINPIGGKVMERKYVIFNIASEKFGIEIARIKEVSDYEKLTTISDSYDYVEGLINMRGVIVPIVNLRNRLKLQSEEEEINGKIIVTNIRDEDYGFLVDSTSEIVNISDDDISQPSALVSDMDSDYVKGIAKYNEQLVIVLDFDKVID